MAETWLVSCPQLVGHVAIVCLGGRAVVDVDHYCKCLSPEGTGDVCREQHGKCHFHDCAVVVFGHSIVLWSVGW